MTVISGEDWLFDSRKMNWKWMTLSLAIQNMNRPKWIPYWRLQGKFCLDYAQPNRTWISLRSCHPIIWTCWATRKSIYWWPYRPCNRTNLSNSLYHSMISLLLVAPNGLRSKIECCLQLWWNVCYLSFDTWNPISVSWDMEFSLPLTSTNSPFIPFLYCSKWLMSNFLEFTGKPRITSLLLSYFKEQEKFL